MNVEVEEVTIEKDELALTNSSSQLLHKMAAALSCIKNFNSKK